MFKIIGLVISFGTVAVLILMSGTFSMFIDVPSALIMLGVFLGGAIFGYGNNIFTFIRLSKANKIKSADLFITLDFYNYLSKLTIYAAMISAMISSAIILSASAELAAVGPAIAMNILTCFYGMLITFLVLQPLKHSVLYRNMNSNQVTPAETI